MAWFWQWKERYLREREQKQKARDEASRNWEAKVEAEGLLETCQQHRDKALKDAKNQKESLSTMSARVEALSNERDAERKAKEAAMDKAVQMEGKRDQYKRERDEARAERDALKVDQRDKDALCAEKNELRQQVSDLEAELEKSREGAAVAAAEKRSLIADRDGLKEEKDKQDVQNGLLHKRIKTLLEEKEAQRVELARLRDKEANRPVVEVELREGVQGPKRVPCFRYRAVNTGSDVVAVSAPQGVPTRDRAEKRIGLLSDARWVIYKVVGRDGKVTYPKE